MKKSWRSDAFGNQEFVDDDFKNFKDNNAIKKSE